jgi:hypothetical protein
MGNPIMYDNFILDTIFKQGYDKALLDVKNYFERHSIAMKQNKMYNQKGINALLQAMLDNIEIMREEGEFIEFTKTIDGKVVLSKKSIE